MAELTTAVLGATGRTGRPVVSALARRGVHVRAVTRNPDRTGVFTAEVEQRFGDLQDAQSLRAAMRGATTAHYIPPSLDGRDPDYLRNIIAAAEDEGVTRIVYHSVLHSNTPEMPHHIRKAGCERLLRQARLPWTILQPAMYAQTALSYFDADTGLLSPPFDPLQPFTLVDSADLAEAAAVIHTAPGHEFATYELASDERLDFLEMAEQLAGIVGRAVSVRATDTGAYVTRFAAARGLTTEQARERRLMFEYYDRHGLVGNGNVLRMILGREPTSFARAARNSLAGAEAFVDAQPSQAA